MCDIGPHTESRLPCLPCLPIRHGVIRLQVVETKQAKCPLKKVLGIHSGIQFQALPKMVAMEKGRINF